MKSLSKFYLPLFLTFSILLFGVGEILAQCTNSAGLLSAPNTDDVGIHTVYPDKPLHIKGHPESDCNDPAIKLSAGQPEYAGYLSLLTSLTSIYSSTYTEIQNKSIGDLVLTADADAGDIILSTHSNTGCIRFATTPTENGDDVEWMTIIPIGHVGIFETDPKEPLQIGSRLTFHIGANNDFIGYNEYVDCYNDRRRMLGAPSSCLNFKSNGQIYLGAAGSGPAESEVSYVEAGGGISGITVSNSNSFGCIGIGAFGEIHNRLLVRGMGSTSATNAVKVTNSSGTSTLFIIRDDQRVGIGVNSPEQKLHVDGNVQIGDSCYSLALPDEFEYRLSVYGQIVAQEIIVELNNWSDFVFDNNYELLSLNEIDAYIKENKRLPGIPGEDEIKTKGVNLGEMQAKLLQKIEEMTLHLIELKNENIQLTERIEEIEKKNKE